MTDLRARVEQARLNARLSQVQLGRTLEITQGHYSKVMSGKVPLTDDLRRKMDGWLANQDGPIVATQFMHRMQELAASIRRQCIELMHLADLTGAAVDETRDR